MYIFCFFLFALFFLINFYKIFFISLKNNNGKKDNKKFNFDYIPSLVRIFLRNEDITLILIPNKLVIDKTYNIIKS